MTPYLKWIALVAAIAQFIFTALPPGNADLISIQLQAFDLSYGDSDYLYPGKDFVGNSAWVAHHERNMRALHATGEPNWCFYPPLLAFVLRPFARINPEIWRLIWAVVQIAALIGLARLTEKFLSAAKLSCDRVLIYALFVGSYPVLRSIELGQTSLVVSFVAWLAIFRSGSSKWLAGIAFGATAFIKPFVLIAAIAAKRTVLRNLLLAAASLVLLLSLSVIAVGLEANTRYVEFLQTLSQSHTAFVGNQSLLAGILRSATSLPCLDYSFAMDDGITMLARIIAIMILGMTAVAFLRSRDTNPVLSATLGFSAVLIALPISWEHHLVLLLPGLAYLWAMANTTRMQIVLAVISALMCVNWTPLYDEFNPGRLIANFPLFGNLLLFVLLIRERLIYRYQPVLTTPL